MASRRPSRRPSPPATDHSASSPVQAAARPRYSRLASLIWFASAEPIPSSILVVTFTAEAARRLRHEVGRQLDSSRRGPGHPHAARLRPQGRRHLAWQVRLRQLTHGRPSRRGARSARACRHSAWLGSVQRDTERARLGGRSLSALRRRDRGCRRIRRCAGALAASYEDQLQRRGAHRFSGHAQLATAPAAARRPGAARSAVGLPLGARRRGAGPRRRFNWRWCSCSPRCTAT